MLRLVRVFFAGGRTRQRRSLTLGAAVIAVAALLGGGGSQIVRSYESLTSTDRLIELSVLLSGRHEAALPVTLIEVDDETRLRWGNPLIVPHAAIAALAGIARSAGARALLVDLDLSSEAPDAAADPALLQFVNAYPGDAPPLMLVRIIRFRGVPQPGQSPAVVADSIRATPYDLATAGKANIFWVSALPELGEDRAVRRVRLWQTVCDGAQGTSFPSPALVMAALAATPDRLADLARFLEARVSAECGGKPPPGIAWPPRTSQAAEVPFSLMNGALSRFLRIGAWSLVGVDQGRATIAGEADRHPFEGRIVLIGATHADSHDNYLTPIGSMPGVTILANTMAMARPMVETPEASFWRQSAVALALFAAFAAIAARFHGLIAAAAIGSLGLAALMGLSRLLGFGAAVEIVALGLTLFALFKILDAAAGIGFDWRHGLGWRALLKHRPESGSK